MTCKYPYTVLSTVYRPLLLKCLGKFLFEVFFSLNQHFSAKGRGWCKHGFLFFVWQFKHKMLIFVFFFNHTPGAWLMKVVGKFASVCLVERVQYLNLTTRSLKWRKSYSIQRFWRAVWIMILLLCLSTVSFRRQMVSVQRVLHRKCTRQGKIAWHSDGESLHTVFFKEHFWILCHIFSWLLNHVLENMNIVWIKWKCPPPPKTATISPSLSRVK